MRGWAHFVVNHCGSLKHSRILSTAAGQSRIHSFFQKKSAAQTAAPEPEDAQPAGSPQTTGDANTAALHGGIDGIEGAEGSQSPLCYAQDSSADSDEGIDC